MIKFGGNGSVIVDRLLRGEGNASKPNSCGEKGVARRTRMERGETFTASSGLVARVQIQ